jgi:hypothetical protein
VGLVLPDPALRLALLPAAELKARRRAELDELLRFRLHKALPFDVRQARLAWSGPVNGQYLVAVLADAVLAAYEKPLVELGFDVGLVEAASLALLDGVGGDEAGGDTLLVNWEHGFVSLIVSRRGWPILTRTLAGELDVPAIAREVASTLLYHRERLGGAGLERAVVRSGKLPPHEAATLLAEPLGLRPAVLGAGASLGEQTGGVEGVQAMAGALACLARRAA